MQKIDLDQARRRAKELLKAATAGDPDALARLPRRHDPVVLADAQLAIARELGHRSWPQLVGSVGWVKARHDDVDWSRVQRVTIVPFIEERDDVVVPDDGLPSGEVRPGEDVVVDAVFRVTLEHAGFRRQTTHVLATTDDGAHVAVWAEGYRYTGRRPHRADSRWWTGPPSEVDDELVRMAAEARAALTHDERVTDLRRILDPSYINADTPQGGSGFSGTLEEWTDNHRHIADAIEHDGTFLDVGCANGFLMEGMVDWCAERGLTVEPYGVDISPPLAQLARQRLPQWADRIWVGDALAWAPPHTFDVVHSLLDTVQPAQRRQLIDNVLSFVAPGGRLVLSKYGPTMSVREVVEPLGFAIEAERGLGVYLRKPEEIAVDDGEAVGEEGLGDAPGPERVARPAHDVGEVTHGDRSDP